MLRTKTAPLTLLCGALGGVLSGTSLRAQAATPDRPNIIYVMLDDAGYADFGAFGSAHVKTPSFDRMCKEGMRFTHHYSSSAVCAPTRCALLTGLHTGHCRRRDNTATGAKADFKGRRPLVFLEPEDVTIGEVMQRAGYATGGIGKWGIGNPGTAGSPDKQGFDHFYGYLDQVHAHNHYTDWLWRNGKREAIAGNAKGAKGTYVHDLFEADTLRFIREHHQKRFFLYLPYTLPHGKYDIPDSSAYKDQPWPQKVKNYAAMITRADATVGRILDLLKKLELDENTVVFFTSDNGPNRPFLADLDSNGPFRGTKRQLTEGGLRAAMVARWPGKIPAGKTSDFVWSMVDFMKTASELAGVEPPKHADGTSIVPTLLGQTQKPIAFQYWEIHHPFQQAVRLGKWKGIRYGTKEPIALYDVTQDPGEATNVAEENAAAVKSIAAVMEREHVPSKYYPAIEKRKPRRRGGRRRKK